jgi:hypothetical protein
MLSTLELDQPCSIEVAVRQLRALARLLAQTDAQADAFVEIALSRFVDMTGSINLDAIPFPMAYSYLRQELMSAPGAGEDTVRDVASRQVHCLPFPVREAALLHAVANLTANQIAILTGDTRSAVESRISLALKFGCQSCPVNNIPPLAA